MPHLYRMRYRPASLSTLPRGLEWVYVEAPPDLAVRRPDLPVSKHRFGVISTVRSLTAEEMESYEIDAAEDASVVPQASAEAGTPPSASELQEKRKQWARDWFAGNAYCPHCSGSELQSHQPRLGESSLYEDWHCTASGCERKWIVEYRESAAVVVEPDGSQDEWIEREEVEKKTRRVQSTRVLPKGS